MSKHDRHIVYGGILGGSALFGGAVGHALFGNDGCWPGVLIGLVFGVWLVYCLNK